MKLLIVLSLVAAVFAEQIDFSKLKIKSFENKLPALKHGWSPSEGRITNGQPAVQNQLPYQVAMYMNVADSWYFCGGSLISQLWVLSAAHCVQNANLVYVILGTLQSGGSEGMQAAEGYIIHENYNKPTQLANDIALVKLKAPVTISASIKPVSLPPSSATPPSYAGSIAITSGWGRVATSSTNISPTLNFINVPVIANADCAKVFGGLILDSMVCIGTSGTNKSTCFGDSGGPLVTAGVLIGVTSFVASDGCELGYPAGFTRVTSHLSWIKANSGVGA